MPHLLSVDHVGLVVNRPALVTNDMTQFFYLTKMALKLKFVIVFQLSSIVELTIQILTDDPRDSVTRIEFLFNT